MAGLLNPALSLGVSIVFNNNGQVILNPGASLDLIKGGGESRGTFDLGRNAGLLFFGGWGAASYFWEDGTVIRGEGVTSISSSMRIIIPSGTVRVRNLDLGNNNNPIINWGEIDNSGSLIVGMQVGIFDDLLGIAPRTTFNWVNGTIRGPGSVTVTSQTTVNMPNNNGRHIYVQGSLGNYGTMNVASPTVEMNSAASIANMGTISISGGVTISQAGAGPLVGPTTSRIWNYGLIQKVAPAGNATIQIQVVNKGMIHDPAGDLIIPDERDPPPERVEIDAGATMIVANGFELDAGALVIV
jgi:hypothetical protein